MSKSSENATYSVQKTYAFIDPKTAFLLMEGADSANFLQRMTTANILNIEPGQSTGACLLQATGKIVVYFNILRLEEQRFLLFSAAGIHSTESETHIFDALEKFHFMEKFTITKVSENWKYIRYMGPEPLKIGQKAHVLNNHFFTTNKHHEGFQFNSDQTILIENPHIEEFVKNMETAGILFLKDIDMLTTYFAEPVYPYEISEKNMPLEVGLDYSVHENKGCYPGQEVIERIRSMGQVPRRFIVFKTEGESLTTENRIFTPDHSQEVGVVTRISRHPFVKDQFIGLAIVKKTVYSDSKMSLSLGKSPITAFPGVIR